MAETETKVQTVHYSSNNSGGDWWLTDQDWLALEKAGWHVEWSRDESHLGRPEGEERWLGALATAANREGLTLAQAIAEWEEVTGQRASALGCSCCGTPHSFTHTGADGRSTYWSPDYPAYGDDYGDRE